MKEHLCKSLGGVISAITDMYEGGFIISADDLKSARYGWTLENPETEPVWISISITDLMQSKEYPETVINTMATVDGRHEFAKAALSQVGFRQDIAKEQAESNKAPLNESPITDRWDELMF